MNQRFDPRKELIYISSTINLLYIPRNIGGLVQDCSNSIAKALELLQSCTNPSICTRLALGCVFCDAFLISPIYFRVTSLALGQSYLSIAPVHVKSLWRTRVT